MIFFVYYKRIPGAPWTVYGTYEKRHEAEAAVGLLFGEGRQVRIVS